MNNQSISRYSPDQCPVELTGKKNPIELPVIDIGFISDKIGEKVTSGNVGTIYQVKDCTPPRVYKVIPQNSFENGDEIRISEIAGKIGIAPVFHSAFVVKQNDEKYVVIEMDDIGKSLGKYMEDLADNNEILDSKVIEEPPLDEKEKAFREMLKKIHAEMELQSKFTVVEVIQKKRLSIKKAVNKLYGNQESFYLGLFNKIKMLAENKIAYRDSHVGNIMPNKCTNESLMLIDFDAARLMMDTQSAAQTAIQSIYNKVHFDKFKVLENLSDKSKQLIDWFKEQEL